MFLSRLYKLIPQASRTRHLLNWVKADVRTVLRTPFPWRHLEQRPLHQLVIETTNICNANCIFCAYRHQHKFRSGVGVMSKELFHQVIGEYFAMGGKNLSLTPVVGEAMMDPDIIPRLKSACDKGFDVIFYTNGIFLHRIDLVALVESGVKCIHISTSPLDSQSHGKIFRTRHYDELLNGLRKFLEVRNRLAAPLFVFLEFRSHIPLEEVLARPDYREKIHPLLTEEERSSVAVRIIEYSSWGGLIKREDLEGKMDFAIPPQFKHRPCEHTFYLQVLYDGKVRACPCYFGTAPRMDADDGLLLGDLSELSLQQIWESEKLRTLRIGFTRGEIPDLCKSCTTYRAV